MDQDRPAAVGWMWMGSRLGWDALTSAALSVILPSPCVCCGAALESPHERYVCDSCWVRAVRLKPPLCRCGHPTSETTPLCAACITNTYPYDGGRSAFHYVSPLREVIHAFKYGGRPALARQLADRVLAHVGPESGSTLVPVPSHASRIRERGFNPADELSRAIAASTGLTIHRALRKKRKTRAQAELGARARATNLQGAFEVERRYRGAVQGGNFTLVDDVYTTGATIRECASVLKDAGASSVHFLTVARNI